MRAIYCGNETLPDNDVKIGGPRARKAGFGKASRQHRLEDESS